MKKRMAYNICDAMELANDGLNIPTEAKYIYLGSYFCDRYFCGTSAILWKKCFEAIRKHGKLAVLVIPTPSQDRLDDVKSIVCRLALEYGDVLKEIVLNDFAMLEWSEKQIPVLNRWCGRMLSKETRDPRYENQYQSTKLFDSAAAGDLFGCNVIGVEIDPIAPVCCREGGCKLGIHVPYAYVTMGRICELASIGLPLNEKFRLANKCSRQCVRNWLVYETRGTSFIKHGRAVFTPNEEVVNMLPDVDIRIIRSAIDQKLERGRKAL